VPIQPRRALPHHPGDLRECLLRDGQGLGEDRELPQAWRHQIQVPLLVHDVLGHVAVRLFDAAFGEVAGVAEVLMPRPAGQAAGMGTRTAYGRDDEVTWLEALDRGSGRYHLGQRLVADHQVVITWRGRPVLERADLPVGAADADVEHPHKDLVR